MTAHLIDDPPRVILLDIEGTTTPISFVYDVLFPYARRRAKEFLARNLSSEAVRADLESLERERKADFRRGLTPPAPCERTSDAWIESLTAYIHWLMDRDRKSTPLKSIQGKIWEEGYRSGELRGQVFDDVPRAFARWRDGQRDVCIYSSGSRLAQRLLFAHTQAGDLTGFIREYFDTGVGAKQETESYLRISEKLARAASEIVFISDIAGELDSASASGLRTLLCVRPGNHPQPQPPAHAIIRTFDEMFTF
jgi:enolase-phosphatase E1